jgi:hypothetical protein
MTRWVTLSCGPLALTLIGVHFWQEGPWWFGTFLITWGTAGLVLGIFGKE